MILTGSLFLNTETCLTQTSNERYSFKKDSLWSENAHIQNMTQNGHWIAIIEDFLERDRDVIVLNTISSKQFKFSNAENLKFSKRGDFFSCIINEKLIILNLDNDSKIFFRNVMDYDFSNDGNFIAALLQDFNGVKSLKVYNVNTQKIEAKIDDVVEFKWHPNSNVLLAKVKKEKIQLLKYSIEKGDTLTLEEKIDDIVNFGWNDTGTASVVLLEKEGLYQINYYNENKDEFKTLSNRNLPQKFKMYELSDRKPFLDNDGKKVLFYLKAPNLQSSMEVDAQIWDSYDPWIEPRMEQYRRQIKQYYLMAWFPYTEKIIAIETDDAHSAALDKNHDFAVIYNELKYEPLHKFFPNADLYLKEIETGKVSVICENQYTEGQFVSISPNGKYISYFRDSDWWVYNIANGQNLNLTHCIEVSFENREPRRPGDIYPYGNPGWLQNEEQIILYDKYDIWIMSPDGKTKRRITKGREENQQFRIHKNYVLKTYNPLTINSNFSSESLNIEKGIILDIFDFETYKTGVAFWKKEDKIENLILTEGKIDDIIISEDLNVVIFRKQRFDHPTSFHRLDLNSKKEYVIYQTNSDLMKYDLGSSEFIEYVLEDGTSLRGSLIYPAYYNSEKIYPLIVSIYEKKSKDINIFKPPSNYMLDGFNLLKFILSDYFVLYPDIDYTIGNPGISAVKSVTAAVDKTLETGKIDKDRIGIIGHSFGGYETAFIISQTNIFAAAVAGAAVTNMVQFYHDVNWDWRLPQMWRMENQQFRFGDSFYNMKENYYENSPLFHVEKINTPLLLWVGNLDTNINWNQSVQMFMALKRLNKKSKLIVYKEESHNILNRKNQENLTKNIFDWMERYVKK